MFKPLHPMHLLRLLLLVATALLLTQAPLRAQLVGGEWATLHQFDGQAAYDFLGWSVSDAGDVDGDGFGDVIVGAPVADPGGLSEAGSAYIYSGATGALIWRFDGQAVLDKLGNSVSGAGDVDGDGFDDVIVGAPWADPGGLSFAGSAYVYSGATGGLLWQFDGQVISDRLGWSVSGAGDVDGDGFDDVIVGAAFAQPGGLPAAGSAYVYSGGSGALLWQFDGQAANAAFGISVSGAGDVDGDGFDDVIVGAPWAAGSTFVYSGGTGALLWQFDGQAAGVAFGSSVSGAGDVDGDGLDDLIVGAPGANPGGLSSAGSAYVYSGGTGTLLLQFDGQAAWDYLGQSVSGAGDTDRDGFDDLIVGADGADSGGLSDAGSAYFYSGGTGALLLQFDGQAAGDSFGSSVSGAGDVDRDGFDDLIVGADGADSGGLVWAGSAYVFRWNPFLVTTSNTISASSTSITSLQLSFPIEAAQYNYRVLLSAAGTGPFFHGVEIPLTLDNYVLATYFGSYSFPYTSNMHGTLNANAMALASIGTPAGFLSGAVGRTIHFAAIASPPGQLPAYSSVAVPIEIVP